MFGLFNLFKKQPKLTPEQEMRAMAIAMSKQARGEAVPGLKIEANPRDPRMTSITLDPKAALELLGGESKPQQAQAQAQPQAVAEEYEYCVCAGVVDADGDIDEFPIGSWGEYEDYDDALYYAELQAEEDGLVKNVNMADTWTQNADDTDLESGDYVIIAKRPIQ